ncbi:transcript variant X2 [Nothobranchius furzeri]|uniref:Transcript variant X2 n=3 Tax=Nothobranchius furzeri TaxID=105023 RepID=A0A9D3BX44_NOTFU|nr:transcript variant X2 [Nothobranchius furzeri]
MPCAFSGHIYQHGEDFQHVCQHKCTCVNGVVGCMPLCPYQLPLPRWRCLRPRLARPKGGCCEEWVCDDDNHISEDLKEQPIGGFQPEGHLHSNHIDALLQAQPRHPADSEGTTFREAASLPMSDVFLEPHCSLQITEWTPCSATCGMGISSRVTNNNPDCRLVRESRLCQIQQCGFHLPVVRKGKKCQRTVRPQEAVRVSFAGCATAQRYRPRTCGGCTDGRCCTPSSSRTVRLRFKCPDGESFYYIMWIQSCHCSRSCFPYSGLLTGPSVSLYNDIHTVTD